MDKHDIIDITFSVICATLVTTAGCVILIGLWAVATCPLL
jgi:hypothetical protein